MNIKELLEDKTLKPSIKTETLSQWVVDKTISIDELLEFAQSAKESPKATCIEALEYATKNDATIANEKVLQFVTLTLIDKAPRVKWESAKVIGNICHLFPNKLDKAIVNLLTNAECPGTVVRWAAAYALGEILNLNTKASKELLPAIEAICDREEKNSIRNIYFEALKKAKK